MPKVLMSFKLEKETTDYLKVIVKNSGMSMSKYLEVLIENDRDQIDTMGWSKGCVITEDSLKVVSSPYYSTMVSLIENGVGILAAIPDDLIPLEKCIDAAKSQGIASDDVVYSGGDICEIFIHGESLARYLADSYKVDLKSKIIGR